MSRKTRKQPIDAFFRDLPGRWRPGPKGKKSDDLLEPWILERGLALQADTGRRLVCWCDECGVVITTTDGESVLGTTVENRWEWSDPIALDPLDSGLDDHRHDEDVEPGKVRWYRLRAIGTWKEVHVTSLGEMLANHPFFTRAGFPAPSLAVMNDALLLGRYDRPRAAGIEFPPLQIDPEVWPELRLELVLRRPALVDSPVPDDVTTMEAFEGWWNDKLNSFSEGARQHQRELILQATRNLDGLTYDTPEWHLEMAKVNALMANMLLVLENFDA